MRGALLLALLAGAAGAQEAPYAGEDGRPIAALSAADVAALERGEGWGLARPAELNGWPGPAHVLELGEEMALTAEQVAEIEAIWAGMNAEAQAVGAELIAAEAALDAAFAARDVDAARLVALTAAAEDARARLRVVHLAAHLETAPTLSPRQVAIYAERRGYGAQEGAHGAHGTGHDGG